MILLDTNRAFCVETYISSRSFGESRRLLDRKLGWDHRKTRLVPNNTTINRWANSKVPGCFAGNRTGQRQTSLGPLRGGTPAGRAAVRPGQPGEVCKGNELESRAETDLTEYDSARRPAPPSIQDTSSSEADTRGQEQACEDGAVVSRALGCPRPSLVH